MPELEDGTHTKDISDGYHTFGELYRHRHALFVSLLRMYSALTIAAEVDNQAWWTREHHPDNQPMFEDMILVGLEFELGSVQYHLPVDYISSVDRFAKELPHGPFYDGTTDPDAVVGVLEKYISYEPTKWQLVK